MVKYIELNYRDEKSIRISRNEITNLIWVKFIAEQNRAEERIEILLTQNEFEELAKILNTMV